MPTELSQEFGPEELLGHLKTALVALDDQGKISSFNRTATRLFGLEPNVSGRAEFSPAIMKPDFVDWLKTSTSLEKHFLDRSVRPLDLQCVLSSPKMKVITATDASSRLALAARTESFEKFQSLDLATLNSHIRATALLGMLRDYSEDPTDLRGVLEMARRAGRTLFPNGGAISLKESSGHYALKESWGVPFSMACYKESECDSAGHQSGSACLHFLEGFHGMCVKFNGGMLSLLEPTGVNRELVELFADTIDLGISNLD